MTETKDVIQGIQRHLDFIVDCSEIEDIELALRCALAYIAALHDAEVIDFERWKNLRQSYQSAYDINKIILLT